MLNIDTYKNWFLPSLLKDSAWNEFIEVILGEIVELQRYNMGSYNAVGFNKVEEDIKFEYADFWEILSEFDASQGIYVKTTEGFSLSGDEAIFTKNVANDSFLLLNYAFVLGKKYNIEFTIYDVDYSSDTELSYGFGGNVNNITISMGTTEIDVSVELTATDYYYYYGILAADNGAGFKIKNQKITGVIEDSDSTEHNLVLLRLTSINNASRYFLEQMRDSINFPSIANMPEELLRQLLKDYNTFISFNGSHLASLMFFYFMGFAIDVVDLYATKGDYEAQNSSYIAQKTDDLFESVRPDDIYGEVAETAYSSNVIKLKEGHQVIAGDDIADQDNPFPNTFVRVNRIDGQYIYLEKPVTVYYNGITEEGDLLDIYRLYTYPVNPDPNNFFKTSHIDIFFKQKYLEGLNIDFSNLESYFERYLPVNVVIRFFGYKDIIDPENFEIGETLFKFRSAQTEGIDIGERVTYPKDDHAFLVGELTPVTHKDINGLDVDGYSYLISHYIGGDPVFMTFPYTHEDLYPSANLYGDYDAADIFEFNNITYLRDRRGYGRHLPVVSGVVTSGRIHEDAIIDMSVLGNYFDKRNHVGGGTGIERYKWPLQHWDSANPFNWKASELEYNYLQSKILTSDDDKTFTNFDIGGVGIGRILYYSLKQTGAALTKIKDYLGIT